MYLVRGIYANGKYATRFCKWEENYNLLPATRDNFDGEHVIFARVFTNEKRARECKSILENQYSEWNKKED